MNLYHSYVGYSLSSDGISWSVLQATEERIGDRVFVNNGGMLSETRDHWHETKTAAMDEAAARIETIAAKLKTQALKIRAEAAALRAKAAEEDERYDRGLPPQMEVEA